MSTYKHNQPVTLTDTYGGITKGTLHLPDAASHSSRGVEWLPRSTNGGYGVHTIRLGDGRLFRTEGRLT